MTQVKVERNLLLTNAIVIHPDPPPYYKAAEPPLPPNYNQNYLPEVGPYSDPYKATYSSPPPPPFQHPPPISTSANLPPVADNVVVVEGFSFKDTNIRKAFLRKVYAILFVQLIVSVGIVSLFTFIEPLREFIRDRFYLILVAGGIVLIVYLLISYSSYGKRLQRKYPENIVLVIIVTILMATFAGTIASFLRTEAVIFGLAITAGVCLIVSVLSLISRFSAEGWGVFLVIILLCGIWFAIFTPFTYRQTWYIQVVYGLIGAIVLAIFLAYDTARLIDKEDNDLNQEDYIIACIRIYTDIILIFVFILAACAGGGGCQ